METAEKSTKRQTLVSKILAGLYYFVMGTWPFWILLYFNIDYQMHNAKNSPYKTVGTVYEVGYKRISYMDLTFYVNNKKYMASTQF